MDTIVTISISIVAITFIVITLNLLHFEGTKSSAYLFEEAERQRKLTHNAQFPPYMNSQIN